MLQLRKIGRKYKLQVEDLQKVLKTCEAEAAVVKQKLSSSEEERSKQQQQTAEVSELVGVALRRTHCPLQAWVSLTLGLYSCMSLLCSFVWMLLDH